MAKRLSDAHIQILGAAANGWLYSSRSWDGWSFSISTMVPNENGKLISKGTRSIPRVATVLKLQRDGLLVLPEKGGVTPRLTKEGRAALDADERTVEVVAGRTLQVVLKNPPVEPNAPIDLSEYDKPIPKTGGR
ncbi:hypothetical protein [Kitasatospora sp. NPDC087315]|uniref:hypothetical protein n=1 Tax=Kitasatospora sp. NPDC087315 TaxID=3364069 RepID=UPI0037FC3B98